MLGEQELEDFFAHIDEISQDSACTDQYQQINKLKSENNRLKVLLSNLRCSTKEVLNIVKNERQHKLNALQELERSSIEIDNLRKSFDELDNSNVNNQFKYKENLDDLEIKHRVEHENYIELSKDYFEMLSEATAFYNFEIKKDRNKILCKTSRFLQENLGDSYKKPKIIVKRSSAKDSKASKRARSAKEKSQNSKRKKVDIWEMKSISEASSPMSFHDEIDETTESDTEYSFKTFSIGNETAFSSWANRKINTVNKIQCKCQNAAKDPELVSVGVNTEDLELEIVRSLPSISDGFVETCQNDFMTLTENQCDDFRDLPEISESNNSVELMTPENIECDPPKSPPRKAETKSIGTATDNVEHTKETRNRSTSPISVEKSNKSTSTVHSVTHRGTMTPARVTKNIGIQFPEITFENILEEMSFEMPHCISPIIDEIVDNLKLSKETQTDLHNVNREVVYVHQKPENADEKRMLSNEDQSFIVLGQTVFNLFMNRLRETNKSLNDDAHTRKRLREQLLDRFDELTFDDYFSPSFVSAEAQENVLRKVFEDVNATKVIKKTNYESNVISHENLEKSSDESEEESLQTLAEVETVMEIADIFVPSENEAVESVLKSSRDEIMENLFGVSPVSSKESLNSYNELNVSTESSQEEDLEKIEESKSSESISSGNFELSRLETEEILKSMQTLCSSPRKLITPIADLTDLIWSSMFPEMEENLDIDSPSIDDNVLSGYDVDSQPIEIPIIGENGTESPFPPPDLAIVKKPPYDPIEIPLESNLVRHRNVEHGKVLEFDASIRLKLVTWQQKSQLKKIDEKRLCKIRKSISNYLNADWTGDNLDKCVNEISNKSVQLLMEAIFETIEDNSWQKDVNTEFTPPAPPLPRYQQKMILLISKLTECHPNLPHRLVIDLEMRLFKCENSSPSLEYLNSMAYYYSSLIDLYFDGNPTIVFFFIIKCIYFYGYKAIPMIFVLIKAFPLALPKKSILLKKYSSNVDWEKMTGLEMSKIRLDLEWMDSLDLCVMCLLTNIQMYRRKGQEFKVIYEHELFSYLPKFYGFPLSFIAAPKLLDVLIKRLEDGDLKNLSLSLILFGKRMNKDFTVRTLLKGKLLPLLRKYVEESLMVDVQQSKLIDKVCLLIEAISTILKPLTDEKDKIFNEIFPMIVNILGRSEHQIVQEYCIKAILRLQRFIENHKEVYEIIKHHYEKQNSFSESLQHSIVTFIHRKRGVYFKE